MYNSLSNTTFVLSIIDKLSTIVYMNVVYLFATLSVD